MSWLRLLLGICGLSLLLVHCGPLQNTCTPGVKGYCTCPDGSQGDRVCGDNGRMGPCFCRVASEPTVAREPGPTPTETPAQERPAAREPSARAEPPTQDTPAPSEPRAEPPTGPEPPATGDAGPPPEPPCTGDGCGTCEPKCPRESQCVAGRCVCPAGQKICTRYCADLDYDPFHCGACNKPCSESQACIKRKCQCFFSRLAKTFDLGCAFIVSIAFSRNGKLMAAIDDNGNKCGSDLSVWDPKTLKLLHEFKAVTYRPQQVLIDDDGDTLYVRVGGKRFNVMSLKQKKQITYLDARSKTSATCAALDPTPNSKLMAVGTGDPSVVIMERKARKIIKNLTGQSGGVRALAYRGDGKRLAVALDSKQSWIYDTQSWSALKKLNGLSGEPTSIAYNKAGDLLAIGQKDGKISLWEPDAGTPRRLIAFQSGFVYRVYHVGFSADGKYLFSAWADRTAKIHDVATGRLLYTIGGHRNEVRAFGISPDGKRIATGAGTFVRLWGCP